MKNKGYKNINYISWIVIVLSIAVLYLSYFFFYIPQQESVLQERAFRILKEYGNNLYGKFDYYQTHLKNYGGYYTIRDKLRNESALKAVENLKRNASKPGGEPSASTKEIINLYKVIGSLDANIEAEQMPASQIPKTPVLSNDRKYLIIPHNAGFNSIMPKTIASLNQKLDQQFGVPDQNFIYRVPIQTLMEGLKFDWLLDNIILFDRSMVIHNSRQDVIHDITNPEALCDSAENHQGGVIETMMIRGQKQRLMILPIEFGDAKIYLAGVMPATEFKKKTRTINSQLLTVISGVLLLLLVSIPELKIIMINRQERLKVFDAYGTIISVVMSTGLLILIAISLLKHQVEDKTIQHKRVELISDTLFHNVSSDFHALIDLYQGITDKDNQDSASFSFFIRQSLNSDENFTQIPDHFIGKPVPINEIILIDSAGIVSKAVTKTVFSDAVTVDLSERGYFQNVIDPKRSWLNAYQKRYFIESIKSYNTGYQETAISFLLNEPIEPGQAPVLAITSPIPSLYHQVLPKDIKFLVIDEQGKVLFHSTQSKNLHENFLEECDLDPRLLSAIRLRVDETLHLTYNEKEWLARIKPMTDAPLYHVTLLDHDRIDNRNARIFLFTFYFLIITLICIGIGVLIMRWAHAKNDFLQMRCWSLSWLLLQTQNYLKYKALVTILGAILLFQVLGSLAIDKPVTMLIYQLIYISYTGFVTMTILGRSSTKSNNTVIKSFWAEALALAITGLLIVMLLWRLDPHPIVMLPILLTILLSGFTFYATNERFSSLPQPKRLFDKLPLIPFRLGETQSITTVDGEPVFTPAPGAVKRVYSAFMILWLTSLAVVPVVQYYWVIQKQEERIAKWEQMQHIAFQNLLLSKNFKAFEQELWYKRIQGNGIDSLQITSYDTSRVESEKAQMENNGHRLNSDQIYSRLPDLISSDNYLMTYLKDQHAIGQLVAPDELEYTHSGFEGIIRTKLPDYIKLSSSLWLLNLILATLLVALVIWQLYQYMAENILNTNPAIRIIPETHSLKSLLFNTKIRRILLDSYDGEHCLRLVGELIETSGSTTDGQNLRLEIIHADKLIDATFQMDYLLSGQSKIIWVSDIDQCIQHIKKHDIILSRLMKLNQHAEGKVIVVLPFEFDFINEYYDDYLEENELEKDERTQIFTWRRSWKSIFKSFNKYSGYFVPDGETENRNLLRTYNVQETASNLERKAPEDYGNSLFNQSIIERQSIMEEQDKKGLEKQILDIEYKMEPRYQHIWNNLCNIEKLILFDLADDGITNLKNKHLIKRLVIKGLIIPEPYPRLYTQSFKYFINNAINPDEIKTLESKLNRKGSWHNMRYLILLIFTMLAGFVLISQGISIEKVIGIFAGILALLSGVVRLFDSGVFRPAAK